MGPVLTVASIKPFTNTTTAQIRISSLTRTETLAIFSADQNTRKRFSSLQQLHREPIRQRERNDQVGMEPSEDDRTSRIIIDLWGDTMEVRRWDNGSLIMKRKVVKGFWERLWKYLENKS